MGGNLTVKFHDQSPDIIKPIMNDLVYSAPYCSYRACSLNTGVENQVGSIVENTNRQPPEPTDILNSFYPLKDDFKYTDIIRVSDGAGNPPKSSLLHFLPVETIYGNDSWGPPHYSSSFLPSYKSPNKSLTHRKHLIRLGELQESGVMGKSAALILERYSSISSLDHESALVPNFPGEDSSYRQSSVKYSMGAKSEFSHSDFLAANLLTSHSCRGSAVSLYPSTALSTVQASSRYLSYPKPLHLPSSESLDVAPDEYFKKNTKNSKNLSTIGLFTQIMENTNPKTLATIDQKQLYIHCLSRSTAVNITETITYLHYKFKTI